MGREVNMDSIRALEKQIEEGRGDIIKLKRTRNSLLNISARIPPEILGRMFVCSLIRETGRWPGQLHFDGLQKGSYNFLLVCHHWFEVASRTPELWNFWGNTLRDWKRCYRHSGAALVDLVLDGYVDLHGVFDGPLQGAVRSRVAQGTIRQVHLRSNDGGVLTSIISSLIPDNECAQNKNIESIVWRSEGHPSVDISDFFARSCLSKLRFLDLSEKLRLSSWDHIASRTTLLTTLSLSIRAFPTHTTAQPPTLPMAQLLSILGSNPNLQVLLLWHAALPNDADGFTFTVPLRDLKVLSLSGEFRPLFGLLRRLTLPETFDNLFLRGSNSTMEEISQTIVPYMQEYFRRDARFQDRLGIFTIFSPSAASISVICDPTTTPQKALYATFEVTLAVPPPPDTLGRLFIDLLALTPREHAALFETTLGIKPPDQLFLMTPNIRTLRLSGVELSEGFLQPDPDGPQANRKLFPLLRSLYLEDVTLDNDDWGHLITYLTRQTSDGQMVSLELHGDSPYMSPEVVDEVMGLVEEFIYHQNQEAEDGGSP